MTLPAEQLELLVRAPDGREVVPDSAHYSMSRHGLVISPAMPDNQFFALGKGVASLGKSVQFFIGDWLNEARRRGEKHYERGMELFGMERQTLIKAASVAGKVLPGLRCAELSFDHHESVAKLPAEKQKEWLRVALEKRLSGKELRASVLAGKVVRIRLTSIRVQRDDRQTGVATAVAELQLHMAEIRRAHGQDPRSWPPGVRENWRILFAPVSAFCRDLEAGESGIVKGRS